MKFISFFAGIGGIDLGLERAGHECVGQCEIDPYALKVLEKHWPDVPRFGDITKVKADELPEADLWAGGFPCQDISNAGKQAGIRGSRSGLFFTWMRLVRKIRPRFLLMENVGALLTHGMGDVLGELAESWYDAEWNCIPAKTVGAPHLRDRVFIVANSNRERWSQMGEPIHIFTEPVKESGYWRGDVVPSRVQRISDGLPDRVDRLRCCGNAVMPQVAEYIGRLLMEIEQ